MFSSDIKIRKKNSYNTILNKYNNELLTLIESKRMFRERVKKCNAKEVIFLEMPSTFPLNGTCIAPYV